MRLVLVLTLTALVAAGCGGGGSRRVSSGAACAAVIEFQNREYLGEAVHGAAPALAAPVGTAVVPGCNDTGTTTESATTVKAYTLAGIPAERALAVEDQAEIVYVARGICGDQSMPADLLACLRRG
jgi:hypothetical protein